MPTAASQMIWMIRSYVSCLAFRPVCRCLFAFPLFPEGSTFYSWTSLYRSCGENSFVRSFCALARVRACVDAPTVVCVYSRRGRLSLRVGARLQISLVSRWITRSSGVSSTAGPARPPTREIISAVLVNEARSGVRTLRHVWLCFLVCLATASRSNILSVDVVSRCLALSQVDSSSRIATSIYRLQTAQKRKIRS
jgi:hypothetical protein